MKGCALKQHARFNNSLYNRCMGIRLKESMNNERISTDAHAICFMMFCEIGAWAYL
jgi:succinylglutamate desuccinylase